MIISIFNLEREPQPARPRFTRQHADRVTPSAPTFETSRPRGAHHLRVESISSTDQLRARSHRGHDSCRRALCLLVKGCRRETSRAYINAIALTVIPKTGTQQPSVPTAISSSEFPRTGHGFADCKLDGVRRLVIRFSSRAQVQRQRQHAGVFARTVILQHVWLLTGFAESARHFRTERLMDSALQGFRSQPNLTEHRRDDFSVNRLAAVRRTSKRNLFFNELEAIGSAGRNQRNRLMWFGGRAQVGDRFRRTEVSRNRAVRFNRDNVTAMS